MPEVKYLPNRLNLIYGNHPIIVDALRCLASKVDRKSFFTKADAERALSTKKAKIVRTGNRCTVFYENAHHEFDFPKGAEGEE